MTYELVHMLCNKYSMYKHHEDIMAAGFPNHCNPFHLDKDNQLPVNPSPPPTMYLKKIVIMLYLMTYLPYVGKTYCI